MSKVQTACDRCTQGVMDADNPHLRGLCRCECHAAPEAAQQAPAPAASIAELRTALAVYGKHMEFCEAVKWAAQTPGAVPSARHAACDCGMSNMIEGGPATGYVKALVGCNGLGIEHPAPAPATPASAEPLSLDRYTRTAVQVALCGPVSGDTMHEKRGAEDVALRDVQALLTPQGRRDLIVELAAGLEPAQGPLDRLLRFCAHVASDRTSGGLSCRDAIERAACGAQALLGPAGRVELAADALAGAPSGPTTHGPATIDLGVSAAAVALLASMGAPRVDSPHVDEERPVIIESAALTIGGVVVRAQMPARPLVAADLDEEERARRPGGAS